MKALGHELAVDQLLTMAPRVEGIPMLQRGVFRFPLSLGLIACSIAFTSCCSLTGFAPFESNSFFKNNTLEYPR